MKISIISIFLLIQCSPVFSIIWLSISTIYCLYVREYRDIFKIWGITIGIWYIIFSTSLSNITIMIGFQNTKIVLNYLLENDFIFENLCFQTVFMLDSLSTKLGFSIYIPAVVNIFSLISKLFKDKRAGCSGTEGSKDEKKSSRFYSGKTEKTQSETDMSQCETLANKVEKGWAVFHSSTATSDGKRTVTYSKTWIPGFGIKNACHARDASQIEKILFKKKKKKNES
jgi:hypothetical protein